MNTSIMTVIDPQRVLEVFAAAVELPPADQSAYLNRLACDHSDIAREVASLIKLDHEAEKDEFLASSALQIEAENLARSDGDARASGRIGPFKIVQMIGAGGMGTIYLGERDDDQYQRRVAVKLIKRGMDTDFVLDRFRNERQILANLNHPNIGQLYTGGATEDGRPYFVMEYIEGLPLTQYADQSGLSLDERLRLFRKVCAAVEYAHQNLIVHRDLKPTNILVTAEGEPKLLDFGIAKLLTDSATPEATATILRALTPEYASPEQIKGEPITTANDIYSLGVLLYELLTGQRPYRITKRTPEEFSKVICEQEPAKPSSVVGGPGLGISAKRRSRKGDEANESNEQLITNNGQASQKSKIRNPKSLKGDLDNIVLMALRKEPARRYSSVAAFSEDIQHFLDGRPVSARKDTRGYRAIKFAGRHRVGVAAAMIVLVTLICGIVATAWEAHAARVERARAERRFQDVRQLANSFLFEFHDAIKDLPGALAARQLVVKRALEYLDSLAQEAGGDPALQSELAQAYEKVGSLTFEVRPTIESHRKAMLLNEGLVKAEPQNIQYRKHLSESYKQMSDAMKIAGRSSEAIDYARKSLALLESLAARKPEDLSIKADLADGHLTLGIALEDAGETEAALQSDRQALEIQRQLVSLDPENKEQIADLSVIQGHLSNVLAEKGDLAGALDSNVASFATVRNLFQADPASARYRRSMWASYLRTVGLELKTGNNRTAVEDCERALRFIEQLAAADPKDTGHRVGIAVTHQIYGDALAAVGRTKPATTEYQLAISIGEALIREDPARAEARNNLARACASLGKLLSQKPSPEAAVYLKRATDLDEQSLKDDPQNARLQRELAELSRSR